MRILLGGRGAVGALLVMLATLSTGCATPGTEVLVTRFHAAPPVAGQTIAIVPADPAEAESLAFRARAEAVAAELARIGLRPAAPGGAELVGVLAAGLATRAAAPAEPPVRLGIGLGGGSRSGVSGGVAISTGVGERRAREVADAEMSLAIRRASDGVALWEGRAVAAGVPASDSLDAPALERALARALLSDFPGQSGATRRVRVPR